MVSISLPSVNNVTLRFCSCVKYVLHGINQHFLKLCIPVRGTTWYCKSLPLCRRTRLLHTQSHLHLIKDMNSHIAEHHNFNCHRRRKLHISNISLSFQPFSVIDFPRLFLFLRDVTATSASEILTLFILIVTEVQIVLLP